MTGHYRLTFRGGEAIERREGNYPKWTGWESLWCTEESGWGNNPWNEEQNEEKNFIILLGKAVSGIINT